jgi:hypothetical protein
LCAESKVALVQYKRATRPANFDHLYHLNIVDMRAMLIDMQQAGASQYHDNSDCCNRFHPLDPNVRQLS